jgi:hypothetical protein
MRKLQMPKFFIMMEQVDFPPSREKADNGRGFLSSSLASTGDQCQYSQHDEGEEYDEIGQLRRAHLLL